MSADMPAVLVDAQLLLDVDADAPATDDALVVCLWTPVTVPFVRDCEDPPPDDFSEKGQLDFFDLPPLPDAGVSLERAFFEPVLLRCCLCPLPGIQEIRDLCCC